MANIEQEWNDTLLDLGELSTHLLGTCYDIKHFLKASEYKHAKTDDLRKLRAKMQDLVKDIEEIGKR